MSRRTGVIATIVVLAVVAGLGYKLIARPEQAQLQVSDGTGAAPQLPPPNKTLVPTVNVAPPIGWNNGEHPRPADGLAVAAYADHLDHPRWLYTLPNGDVLVAETNGPGTDAINLKNRIAGMIMGRAGAGVKSPEKIILLRDANGDGVAEQRFEFLDHLYSPFGMALIGNDLYVANANALMRYSYRQGDTHIDGAGSKVIDLPSGFNHHWTKNLLASPDGGKLYITVGSNSNVGENGMAAEAGRAAIHELDLASGKLREFAGGLRNPNGMGWEPETGALWAVVNERDEIGSDLVPDYITSVKDGAFYGWPYSYYGQHVDARVQPQRPDLVARAIAPDYAVGPHTASLGLVFSQQSQLPEAWRHGVFIGQHGSWNRRPMSGYKVIYVPFEHGRPAGPPRDVLTGFLTDDQHNVHGRPVGVTLDHAGALLVADDAGNTVWRVTAAAH